MKTLLVALLLMLLSNSVMAEVSGKVTFKGNPPVRAPLRAVMNDPNAKPMYTEPPLDERVIVGPKGELQNAVVFIKGDLKGKSATPDVVIVQKRAMYSPHVVSATTGQRVLIKNVDPFLHNGNVQSDADVPKSTAQPIRHEPIDFTIKGAEFFRIVCNVHPWMSCWVAAFDHPHHGVTNDAGEFSFPTTGLADGDYDVAVWHERYKECATGKVTVKNGKGTVNLTVEIKPKPN